MKRKSPLTIPLFPSSPIPKMPEGYYSGDKPNPNLKAFVEQHLKEHPYNPETDDYNVPAFDKPIETTKATAIYNMHTYWSKKPHDAIRQYIRHYTKPGDLVLDPFCGSGGTALAALMEGRKAIAIDRSPAATFITKNYCTPVDTRELQKAFEELKQKVKPEIDWLYETRCDRCDGKATTAYTVYSQVFQCPRCMEKVSLFDCVEVEGKTAKGKPKKISICPHCHKRGKEEEISTRSEKFGSIPVLVSYICENGCKPSYGERQHNDNDLKKRDYFKKFDLGKIQEIETKQILHWYPNNEFPKTFHLYSRCALQLQGINKISDFYTKRNLWALATYYEITTKYFNKDIADIINFGLNCISIAMSKMQGYSDNIRFPNQLMRGTYYIPPIGKEYNVLNWLDGKLSNLILGYQRILTEIVCTDSFISTQSAVKLDCIPSLSIDYIFTDPPYADKVFYGELNIVWESWLRFDLKWSDEEIVVKPNTLFTRELWNERMKSSFKECYRVLKPGRYISLCFHGKPDDWQVIQDLMAETGFIVEKQNNTLFIETDQKSYRQITAVDNTLRDLVINFRKPKPGEIESNLSITGDEDKTTFNEKVYAIIRAYIEAHPGATKDRIYDEVVSHMVRSGRMEAHNFDELLRHVAEEVREPKRKDLFENEPPNLFGTHIVSRWYLKETELAIVDAAESKKEDDAAEKIGSFIANKLKEHPEDEGVHYSDIFEYYVYTIKDKPRRPLAEWLLDYFYKTDTGTYRLPQSEEEQKIKADGRAKGTHRRIKRYIAYIQQNIAIPDKERPNDSTLAEWIRHCKRSGLYEQGKLLYEKGGLNLNNLPEEIMVNVEEDYQVCVRTLAKSDRNTQDSKRVKKR